MLIKIFMSRKNTKIYFIVVLLLALLFSSIKFLNNYYIQKNNENFRNSYIFIPKTDYIQKKSKQVNIKSIVEVKKNIESDIFYYNVNVQRDEAINTILVSNNTYNYILNDNRFENIDINICSNCLDNILYMNESLFNNLDIKTIDGYYITLLDWSEVDKVINLFDKESDSMDIRYSEAYNANVLGLTKLLILWHSYSFLNSTLSSIIFSFIHSFIIFSYPSGTGPKLIFAYSNPVNDNPVCL